MDQTLSGFPKYLGMTPLEDLKESLPEQDLTELQSGDLAFLPC